MNTRDRFHAVMNFEPFDRLPVLEWAGWWDQTVARWHQEGLPADLTDRYDVCRHYGMDVYRQDWFSVCRPECPAPVAHGAGIIASEKEYEAIKPCLYPQDAVDKERWEQWALEQDAGTAVLWFTVDGFFWFPRRLLGIEQHLFAFYDKPELMNRINEDLAAWMLHIIEEVCSVCTPDFMTFGEDMSYNKGPMISEELFEAFMRPWYDIVIPELNKRNVMPVIDSDGDISMPAHWFEKAGIEGILPLERQAGVDIAALRRDHPKMKFIGHFDKMTMNKGEKAMRTEFERLLPVAAQGGFLISCDHQTPPGVSYKEYCVYISLFNEYAERAGKMSSGVASAL